MPPQDNTKTIPEIVAFGELDTIRSKPESYYADPRSSITSDAGLVWVQLMFTDLGTPKDGENLSHWQEIMIRNGVVQYQPGVGADWQKTCISTEELKEFVERARALKPGEKEAIIDPQEQRELQTLFRIARNEERCFIA